MSIIGHMQETRWVNVHFDPHERTSGTVWLKTYKLSALGRQPEDVEYCIVFWFGFVLVLVLFWQVTTFNSCGCNESSVGMFGNIPDEISKNL